MILGELIKKYIDEHSMSYEEFGKTCGISKGYVSMLINNRNPKTDKPPVPKIKTYMAIAQSMNMTLDELFRTIDDAPVQIADETDEQAASLPDYLTDSERDIIFKFRALDLPGQRTVRVVLDSETQRMQETAKTEDDQKIIILRRYRTSEKAPITFVRRYEMPSAAGVPIFDDDGVYEDFGYPADIVPRGTDFSVIVAGHSMEPTIHNGDTVFVKEGPDASDKEIVIVWIDGEGLVCKRARVLGDHLVRLESDNSAFPDIEGAALKDARVLGRVLGHTDTPDRPEPFAPQPPIQLVNKTPEEIGKRISAARNELDYSADEVADLMSKAAGEQVTAAQVKAWEAGRYPVPDRLAASLGKILYISPKELK